MPNAVASCSVVKRPSRWRAWLRALEFSLQMILGVSMVCYGFHSYQVRTRLQAVLADLDRTDPGWRLQDIEAARAIVPDAENSALRILEIEKSLPARTSRWIEDDFDEELRRVPPVQRMRPDQFAHLRACLDGVLPVLQGARGLSGMPQGRFPIVYARNPLGTLLPGQQKAREILQILTLDAMARVESGDVHGAVESCRAALNVGRSIGDEPLAITQLLRSACVMIACKMDERILAQGELDSEDLKNLQLQIEEESEHPYRSIVWRGERAFGNAVLEAIESGAMTLSELADERPDWHDQVLGVIMQDQVRSVHPQYLAYTARLQAAADMPPDLRVPIVQQIDLETHKTGPNVATLILAAYPKLADAFSRCHASLRCTTAALAAERYRRLHGEWPHSLDKLTPDLLAAVPTDPFTGEPLLYRHTADGVVIYSVGPDGKDDGGVVLIPSAIEPGTDLGVRLWDVAKRRQPPMPPALPALTR